MAVIQAACDQLSPDDYGEYILSARTNRELADKMEERGALRFLAGLRLCIALHVSMTKTACLSISFRLSRG